MIGTALTIFQNWDTNKKVMAEPVVKVSDEASKWMHEKARQTSDFLNKGYRDMVGEATQWLADRSGPLSEAVTWLGNGYGEIGGKVLSFLDPVSYGLELGGDVIDNIGRGSFENVDAIAKITQGKDVGGNLKTIGKNYLGNMLTQVQLGTSLLPAGHIAGKAAKVPLKAARKELKNALKQTTRGSIEAKAIKHDIRMNKVKTRAGVPMAKAAGITAKERVRDYLSEGRAALNRGKSWNIKTPTRDWSSLTRTVKEENDAIWNRKNLKRR